MLREESIRKIESEQARQAAKWGPRHHSNELWLTILSEEVGEIAQAILNARHKGPTSDITEEVIHATAVLKTWLETDLGY